MPDHTDRQRLTGGPSSWAGLIEKLRVAGADSGSDVADRWAHDTVGVGATGDSAAAARRVLVGIEEGDPAVLDAFPTVPAGDEARFYRDAVSSDAPAFADLSASQRTEVVGAYRDGFDSAVGATVMAYCRMITSPVGDGRDLSHLQPERQRVGDVGVFAGDWAWTVAVDGAERIPVGFVGTRIDTWNGWAVFSCTRTVAEAIVADQQRERREQLAGLMAQGVGEADAERRVAAYLADLYFDGDDIVADQRAQYDDPEAIQRIRADAHGRYVVMGWNWCWQAVNPYDCDRIVGELPGTDEPL